MKSISLIVTMALAFLALGDAAKCNAKTPAPAPQPKPAPGPAPNPAPVPAPATTPKAPAPAPAPAPAGGDSDTGAGSGAKRSSGCGKPAAIKNGVNTAGGRQYIVRLPDNYNPDTAYRVVFAFHWRGGNMEAASKHTGGLDNKGPGNGYYGLEQSGKTSTIFVAPNGNGGGWANGGGSDMQFVDAINKQLDEGLCVNQNLRFALGFSWGAGMSNAVACARADQFRGVALWNGATLSGCDGGRKPIAWWSAHGVSDNVLAISMGKGLRDNFVKVNGCQAQTTVDPAPGSGTHVTTEYKGCSEGHPVVWTSYDGGHIAEPKDRGAADPWGPAAIWAFFTRFK